ncbi:MAG: hypothetical protein IT372_02860 [Polyangiaceae bacterium]|nr:hypothetical protein [Polyangiaceae bacterium]
MLKLPRITFLSFTLAGAFASGAALADVPADPCAGAQAGAACVLPSGESGTCVPDANGALVCTASSTTTTTSSATTTGGGDGDGGGDDGCSVGAGATAAGGAAAALPLLLALGLAARRRRRSC